MSLCLKTCDQNHLSISRVMWGGDKEHNLRLGLMIHQPRLPGLIRAESEIKSKQKTSRTRFKKCAIFLSKTHTEQTAFLQLDQGKYQPFVQ